MTPKTGETNPQDNAGLLGAAGARRLLLLTLCFWCLAFIPAFLFDAELGKGVLAGGGVMIASLVVTVYSLKPLMYGQKMSFFRGFLFWFKYTALLALVGFFIAVLKISSVGFLIGFSVIIPAVVFLAFFKK